MHVGIKMPLSCIVYSYWLDVCMFNVYSIGDYCFKPECRVLKSIRREFGDDWKYVGYGLDLEHSLVHTIELNEKRVEDQAFIMLCSWLQRDVHPCYCKLIAAMEMECLNSGVACLKKCIKQGIIINNSGFTNV